MKLIDIRTKGRLWFEQLNHYLPKRLMVMVIGFPNNESSAIAVANYVAKYYKLPVTYVVSQEAADQPRALLEPGIRVLQRHGTYLHMIFFYLAYMRSKYVFFTHGGLFRSYPPTQVITNIWHGLLYKNVGLLDGRPGVVADVTVGTSELSIPMFARAFGVAEDSVYACGYPRNDLMMRAVRQKKAVRTQLGPAFQGYKKIIIWMPTYRKRHYIYDREDGEEAGNPFYIPDFNLRLFNETLREHDTLCLVKPHSMAIKYAVSMETPNVQFIDDRWISNRGLTLYELVGATDMLISDVSSIMLDYLLTDQPILCVSTDFEAYKKSRGFYFKDIEHYLPGPVINNQYTLFSRLSYLLEGGADPCASRRSRLKSYFFAHTDGRSTERLVHHVFNLEKQ